MFWKSKKENNIIHKKFILLSFTTLLFELPTEIAAFVELYCYRNNKNCIHHLITISEVSIVQDVTRLFINPTQIMLNISVVYLLFGILNQALFKWASIEIIADIKIHSPHNITIWVCNCYLSMWSQTKKM